MWSAEKAPFLGDAQVEAPPRIGHHAFAVRVHDRNIIFRRAQFADCASSRR